MIISMAMVMAIILQWINCQCQFIEKLLIETVIKIVCMEHQANIIKSITGYKKMIGFLRELSTLRGIRLYWNLLRLSKKKVKANQRVSRPGMEGVKEVLMIVKSIAKVGRLIGRL